MDDKAVDKQVDQETPNALPWQKSLFRGINLVLFIIGIAVALCFIGLILWISFGAPPKEEKKSSKDEKPIVCKVKPKFDGKAGLCVVTLPAIERKKWDEESKKEAPVTVAPVLEMVRVEPGPFRMGPAPDFDKKGNLIVNGQTRSVTLKNEFYIGKTEVTQVQWMAVMGVKKSGAGAGKEKRSYYFFEPDEKHPRGSDDLPVDTVSWDEAMAFCKKLNKYGFAPKGWMFTLPTEIQWEYAARGGKKSKGFKYSGGNDLAEVAWCRSNNGRDKDHKWVDEAAGKNRPVAGKKPNELGLYDMNGNVWEWCLDSFEKNIDRLMPEAVSGADRKAASADGRVWKRLTKSPAKCVNRLWTQYTWDADCCVPFRSIRGGNWYMRDDACTPTVRTPMAQGARGPYLGFRVALVKNPAAK